MNSLQQLQTLFMDAIFNGPENNPAINTLEQYIAHNQALSATQQIAIYRDSVIGSMTTALSDIYPVCCKLVGNEFFDHMATQFIYHHQSISPDLGDYGNQFPRFISSFKPAAELVYLADVARLEWAWHRVFHAADHRGLDITQLASLTPQQQETLIFQLPPGSVLLASAYPIDRIWQVNQDDDTDTEIISLDEGEVFLFVWRQAYTMRIDRLQKAEWLLLCAIQEQPVFIELCKQFEHEPAIDIEQLLPKCVQQGWIADFTHPELHHDNI